MIWVLTKTAQPSSFSNVKIFKTSSILAVDNVDLVAKGGKVTILLGPNGAGKSTTIKSIANLLKFDGEIKICGYPNDSIEAKRCFGYVPETPILYDLLTIDEHIDFIGNAYRVDNYHEIANKYLELFKLTGKKKSTL